MKYKKWSMGELVEAEILCEECKSPNVEMLYSDCDAGGYWTMYKCLDCEIEFAGEPCGSES